MRKLKKGQLVEITCYDHASDSSWMSEKEIMESKPPILHVLGRVHHQDRVAIYTSHFGGEDAKLKESDIDTILIGAIIEIWAIGYSGKQPIMRKK